MVPPTKPIHLGHSQQRLHRQLLAQLHQLVPNPSPTHPQENDDTRPALPTLSMSESIATYPLSIASDAPAEAGTVDGTSPGHQQFAIVGDLGWTPRPIEPPGDHTLPHVSSETHGIRLARPHCRFCSIDQCLHQRGQLPAVP